MSVILKERFVRKLHEAMEFHSLTQTELARRMGVSRQLVSQYLSGQKMPGLDIAERFALALGFEDPAALIDSTEITQPIA